MKMRWVVLGFSLLLPIVSAFITYVIVNTSAKTIALDTTQASLICLALMKMLLLGATGVFPIDLDLMFKQALGKGGFYPEDEMTAEASTVDNEVEREQLGAKGEEEEKRGRRSLRNAGTDALDLMNNMLFKTPDVSHTPCIRRFLCEIETIIRTSDDFDEIQSENDEDRHPEEEVDVDSEDQQLELYTEAVHALYGYHSPSAPDSSPATNKVLALMQSLTGKSCETAYKLCPGRYTAPMVFKIIFNEVGFRAKDEL